MRRITSAIALAGAMAIAGCGGGASPHASRAGAGVAGSTFTVNVQNGQSIGGAPANPALAITGGYVTSSPAGIDCGGPGRSACSVDFALGTVVTLTAHPVGDGMRFLGWYGACSGDGACALSGDAEQYVVVQFGTAGSGHANWTPGGVHGPQYFAFARGDAGALPCTQCHGASLQGQGLAVSCASCHAWPVHGGAAPIPALAKPFASGPEVTAECLKCHAARADELLASDHFTWLGSSTATAQSGVGKRNLVNNFCVAVASNEGRCMQCHPSYSVAPAKDGATGAAAVNTGPMYLWSASPAVDRTRLDCLVCHANLATSKYAKAAAPFGAPVVASTASCFPSCAANQICAATDAAGTAWSDGKAYCRAPTAAENAGALQAAAQSVGAPQRDNCGFCHFIAGGGDNVKMGDLGTALKTPTVDVDVHMGNAAPWAPTQCADCHRSTGHELKGTGLSIPIDDEGRLTCTDCHTGLYAPKHQDPAYTAHADFIACQTCHIPAFSRTQYTKVNWDWQTVGDKQACQGLAGCVGFGSLSYPTGGAVAGVGGEAPKQSHDPVTQAYDWKKGVSTYATNVTPAYRWIAPAGAVQGTHETTARNGLTGSGTPEDPYVLSGLTPPAAPVLAGWKIAPFKPMTGRSPAFADGSGMVIPHVFGSDSLWQTDLRGYPVVPNNLGSAANPWTQAKVDAIWTGALNYGAAVGGQLGAAVTKAAKGAMTRDAANLVTVNTLADLPEPMPATLYLVGAEAAFPTGVKAVTKTGPRQFTYVETLPYAVNTGTPALPALPATSTAFVAFYPELRASDWRWANTVMFINLNHEVAPATAALTCASCHPSLGGSVETSRMKELYDLRVGGCEDPALCRKR